MYDLSVEDGGSLAPNEDKLVDKFTAPDFLPNFIDKYRELPCLWQVQCRDYSNKQKRKAVLDQLLELVKSVYPTADINYLKAKIGSLRSTYNRERKKVQDSLRSGAAADDVYVPRVWYYDSLHYQHFLPHQLRLLRSNLGLPPRKKMWRSPA
ncbi:hypothetical protein AB205_0005790 [Aquarana catesbeiana]|uniref:MADF domain-containing protein n=1 Tax=Aquarana catesbeiana TaxID=8400 RepID=A0A2G9R6I7_AQUCT|nr:hypothetical protein AB205_0005790 [Aquarana catesbeiana]